MEAFKRSILQLFPKVDGLEARVQALEGSKPSYECQYRTGTGECGEIPLDDFDTFRFLFSGKTPYPGTTSATPDGYLYILQNPTPDLIAEVRLQTPTQSSPEIRIYSRTPPEKFQDCDGTVFAHNLNNGQYNPLNLTNALKGKFAEKFFEVAAYTGTHQTFPFTRTIEIPFQHTYSILPHVQYFITPLEGLKLSFRLSEITRKGCKFHVTYGGHSESILTTGVLHWQVQGIVETAPVTLLE
jgi:hypothetical protein